MNAKNKPDVTLANGRIVVHSLMSNGATAADMMDGGYFNQAECLEYDAIIKANRLNLTFGNAK
jgi:hypothetical protein